MIRPITNLREQPPSRVRPTFVLTEILLVLAIPVLGVIGLQSVLSSRAGVFVEAAGPTDPGYRAVVEPSPVTALVEITNERLTGIVIVAQPGGNEPGGGLVLIPGELVVDDVALASLPVDDAVAAVERSLHLRIAAVEIVDEARWSTILGGAIIELDNPDPVSNTAGEVLFDVGALRVPAESMAPLLGLAASDADPRSLLFRRTLVWQRLVDQPPASEDPVGVLIKQVASGTSRVEPVPLRSVNEQLVIDQTTIEEVVLDFVPFPAGAEPGDRLRVRLVDQVGDVDLLALARRLAGLGFEVVEIANAGQFVDPIDARNQLLVPIGLEDSRITRLADHVGADTLESNEIDADVDGVVTLLIGEVTN